MDLHNNPPDFIKNSNDLKRDGAIPAAVDLLGGEPLEGTGFEEETPTEGFAFDWTLVKGQIEGGLQ